MSQKTKTKLTIYLIKPDYQGEENMLRDGKGLDKREIPGVGNLYYCASYSSKPVWLDSFFGGALDDEPLWTSTVRAVALIPIEVDNVERYFAITFGYGHTLLNKSAIEERFGLKTVLNSVTKNSIRRVSKTEVAGSARKSNEQMPKQSTISDFTLDVERDLLDGITAVGDKESFLSGAISGADSLSVSSEVSSEGICDFLEEVYSIYSQDTYKKNFAWIDHIMPVKDKNLKEKLDSRLIETINAHEKTIWMAVPSLIEWENVDGFRYNRTTHSDILIEEVLDSFKEPLEHVSQLRNKRISMIRSTDGQESDYWPAYKCLYGEIEVDGLQYCINGGKWYRVESNYVDDINEKYQKTELADISLPHFESGKENENDYNARVVKEKQDDFILMDRKLIAHGGVNDSFELCDVLTRDGKFIHVKKYSGSATLSHLFNQGLTTAELVKGDLEFVQKANKTIAKQSPEEQAFVLTSEGLRIVVFAIISKKDDPLPNIPFFSKITFCNVKKRLATMGITVQIASIKWTT